MKIIIAGLLTVDPKKRLTVGKAVEDEWFNGIKMLDNEDLDFSII